MEFAKSPLDSLSNLKKYSVFLVLGIPILFGFYLTSLRSYLLFHTVIEFFAVIVAACVFVVTWNSRKYIDNTYLLFIGIVFLFIGVFDMLHALSYKGMNIFPGYDSNLPTQLWIAARYYQALALLIAPFLLGRALDPERTLWLCALVTTFIAFMIFGRVFPDCYREGSGLTPFKIVSEYIISAIFIVSLLLLRSRRSNFDPTVYRMLVASILLTVVAEIAFTFYVSVYGLSNLVGHYFKLISFYLIYKAIVQTGFEHPYALLFRNLKMSEENLLHERDMLNQALDELTTQKRILQDQQEELQAQQEELQAQNEELQAQQEELLVSQERIETSNQKYRELYDFAPVGYFNLDHSGTIMDANLSAAGLLGYHRRLLEGRSFKGYVAKESQEAFSAHVDRLMNGGAASDEICMVHQSGLIVPVEIESVAAVSDSTKGVFCRTSVKDATERKLAEKRIKASLEEKEVLLKEVHHRVKNNLQVIRSLMNLQAASLQDVNLKKPFHEARNRISAMSMIHETLYKSDSFSEIDLNAYVRRLVSEMSRMYDTGAGNISFSIDIDPFSIGIDHSVPCGLVLNELISNSLKHAFQDAQSGKVEIKACLNQDEHAEIVVADNGKGLPDGLDLRNTDSLGMKLIYRLVEGQLGGSVAAESDNGARFTIRFPLPQANP